MKSDSLGALRRASAYADARRSAQADRWPEAQKSDFSHRLNSYPNLTEEEVK